MDVNERVMENLKAFGLDTDIKPVTMKHLAKVDEVLAFMVQSQTEAIQEIRNNKISINRVAKESGIARQTFYNNPIITAYIEAYIEANTSANPYETIETLREEIRRKDDQIAAMVQRDATISECKAKNKELTDENVSLHFTITSQEALIVELRKQLKQYQTPGTKAPTGFSATGKISAFKKPSAMSSDNKCRIVSWNVRGIKAAVERGGLQDLVAKYDPDIICLQEILVLDSERIERSLSGLDYHKIINPSKNKQFKSGTIIMSKDPPFENNISFEGDSLADEGRIITCEFKDFYVINIYVPALSSHDRLNTKLIWWEQVISYIDTLKSHKPVLLCGDMNATINDLDVGVSPDSAGCTAAEQDMLSKLLSKNFIDVFRCFYPEAIEYTWHVKKHSQSGMRLDYFFVPKEIMPAVEEIKTLDDIQTSDHSPVLMALNKDVLA